MKKVLPQRSRSSTLDYYMVNEMFRKSISCTIALLICLSLFSCKNTSPKVAPKSTDITDMSYGNVDKDQMAALPQKSLLDESEISEELITNPMLENEMPVWLAKINGKIFAYGGKNSV